ncbi:MAG TPA: acylneuraminate cytidylyltransferase, partial [Spirochaetota bacterium]|nr:acylneuraminate cytidylyltransferase [Spirochaetota bacterium]
IIRITGDNPLTDHVSASEALEYSLQNLPDHCSVAGIPVGTGVEIISRTALERAFRESSTPYHFEHVTPYIKEHPENFKIMQYVARLRNPFPELRLTVDTPEDFELMNKIYTALYRGAPLLLPNVIEFISDHPYLEHINRHIKQRPMTHSSHE